MTSSQKAAIACENGAGEDFALPAIPQVPPRAFGRGGRARAVPGSCFRERIRRLRIFH
jgi:hypothetical protein